MSEAPPPSASPDRPGPGGVPEYRRPVLWPDAETVLLPQFTKPQGPEEPEPKEPETRSLGRIRLPKPSPGAQPAANRGSRRSWVSRAVLLAILILQAVLSLRMHNTAFEDEALFLYSGHLEIAHLLHGAALQGTYASYFPGVPVLYPVLGAAADGLGGLAAARALSLAEMLATTALLYTLTRRLFNERVALCAALMFAVSEGAILLGRLATNDASALLLLALASWIVVRTASWRPRAYLLAAPVAALAVATDYWTLLYLPAVALLAGLAAQPYRGRAALARSLLLATVMAELLAAAVALSSRQYLTAFASTALARSPGPSQLASIARNSALWGGLLIAAAAFGAVCYAIRARTEPTEQIAPPGERGRRIALGVTLTVAAVATVAYQAYLNSGVSLDRHIGLGLFFGAPMAGLGLARLVGDHFRRVQLGIIVWAAAVTLGLAQASQLFGSWVDSSALNQQLARQLRPGARYLVENDDIPIYYLRAQPGAQPSQFTSTFFISYRTGSGQVLSGKAGFLAAVRAGYFRVISYDSTVTPALDRSLAAALRASPRYRLVATVPEIAGDFRATSYVWVRD